MHSADRPATRLATRLSFLVAGFGIACWAPLVPFAKGTTGLISESNPVAGYGLRNWSHTLLKFTVLRMFVPSTTRSTLSPRSLRTNTDFCNLRSTSIPIDKPAHCSD